MELMSTLLAFLVAIAVLIVVHELGHYAVARRCGVKVLRFSVGFGRPIARWVRGADRTEWVIAAVPFGGYVRMLDENDPDCSPIAESDLPRAFNRQSVGRRAAIVVAGPVANLLLAVALYWTVNLVGTLEPPPFLGPPAAQSVAQQVGLSDGDLILSIDGKPVQSWGDVRWALLQDGVGRGSARLGVRSIDGVGREVDLDLARGGDVDDGWFERVGIARGAGPAVVHSVVEGEVAARAGLTAGDRVVQIDGAAVRTAADVTRIVRASEGRLQQWVVERDGRRLDVAVTPSGLQLDASTRIGRVGIDFLELRRVRYGPIVALQRAAYRTWETSAFSLRMAARMVKGEASWRNLSGPVSIADVAGQTARIGVVPYLSFLALVSISLGILNLLPIPILDGGLLLYYAVEVVKGSPLSVRSVEVAQRIGVGVLILLTALALYNDLTRLLS
jgi:regulator of sigma E protease